MSEFANPIKPDPIPLLPAPEGYVSQPVGATTEAVVPAIPLISSARTIIETTVKQPAPVEEPEFSVREDVGMECGNIFVTFKDARAPTSEEIQARRFSNSAGVVDDMRFELRGLNGAILTDIRFSPLSEEVTGNILEALARMEMPEIEISGTGDRIDIIEPKNLGKLLAIALKGGADVKTSLGSEPKEIVETYESLIESLKRWEPPKIRTLDVPREGKGGVREVTGEDQLCRLSEEDKSKFFRWIDIQGQNQEALQILSEKYGLDAESIRECLEFTQNVMSAEHSEYLFLVTHAFSTKKGEVSRPQTQELHAFIGKDFLITVHYEKLPALDEFAVACGKGRLRTDELSPDGLYHRISAEVMDDNRAVVNGVKKGVGTLRAKAEKSSLPSRIYDKELPVLGEQLREMENSLSEEARILQKLGRGFPPFIEEVMERRYGELSQDATRLCTDIRSEQHRLQDLQATAQRESQLEVMISGLHANRVAMIGTASMLISSYFGQNLEMIAFPSKLLFWASTAITVGTFVVLGRYWWKHRNSI